MENKVSMVKEMASDTMFGDELVEWNGLTWLKRPFWGYTHPDYNLSWYDPSLPYIDTDGCMVLGIDDRETEFTADNGEVMHRRWATCYVRTFSEQKYGKWEFEMKCPKGKNLWPALWLASDSSWPPEIDVMEGWSEKDDTYKKNCLQKHIYPTLHWIDNGNHIAKRGFCTWKWRLDCTGGFDKYTLEWKPDVIRILYNGKTVMKCKNKGILDGFNDSSNLMHAILQINVGESFCDDDFVDYLRSGSPMKIRNFEYQEL